MLLLTALLLSLLGSTPSRAEGPVRVGGTTSIDVVGSRVALVRFDHPWAIGYRDVSFSTHGQWSAVVVVGASPRTARYDYGLIRGAAPAGCSGPDASGRRQCPYGGYLFSLDDSAGRTAPVKDAPFGRLTYPAGVYRLYVLTGAGTRLRVSLHVLGETGRTTITATHRAVAAATLQTVGGSQVASGQGSFPLVLRRPGAVIMTAWSAAHPSPVLDNGHVHACLDVASGAAPNELVANETCSEGGDASTVGAVGSTGGGTDSRYDVGGWVDLHADPGSYRVRYSEMVLGDHPGAGVVTLWFEAA